MALPFHAAISDAAKDQDSLHILARGLGQHKALHVFLQSVLTPTSLILGLNIPPPLLPSSPNTLLLPRHLTADYQIRDRKAVYENAGFVTLTPAILIHDLLHSTLPDASVTGLVIFAADRIRERSNMHFALTLLRCKHPSAFVTAFSENAPALSVGFHAVEKLMRLLSAQRLVLWPRFHTAVTNSLRPHQPDLVDLCVTPTPKMISLASALAETVFAVMEDIRNATHAIDMSEIYRQSPETSSGTTSARKRLLVNNFDDVIRRQLEGADTRSTQRVRSLLADLVTLRKLLRDVYELNSILFHQQIVTIRATAVRGGGWLVRKEAQRVVSISRARVWQLRRPPAQNSESADNSQNGEQVPEPAPINTIASLEHYPKWNALRAVLREIASDVKTAGVEADVGRILVCVREQAAVEEITQVLRNGNEPYLQSLFEQVFPSVAARAKDAKRPRQLTLTQLAAPAERTGRDTSEGFDVVRGGKHRSRGRRRQAGGTEKWDADKAREELLEVFGEVKSDGKRIEVLVWCMEWVDLQGRGHHILDEYRPAFVILYNADLALVRQVEVFKASQPGRPVRMYILAYEDAVEEERFRQSSGREKAAFKSLIRERATMTVHVNPEPIPEEVRFTQTVLEDMGRGRKGLGVDRDSRMAPKVVLKKGSEKVLVDTRELRSSLPMLLYQSSLTIVSLTLEVGDFILSKNIGIERKSVPDLYGSFGSGRLFNQAEALCRHYKYPCLLIELDPLRSLSLTATSGGVPTELVATSIVSKMVLLLQQFPSFRLLWAKGPHDAAEMFSTLKANEEEPDESIAAALGVDTKETVGEDFNAGPRALLRSLPGIDSQNMVRVMKKVKDVASLISMSKEEMAEVLGSAGKATSLYEFVNEQPSEALAAL